MLVSNQFDKGIFDDCTVPFGVTLTTRDDHAPVTVGVYRFIGAHTTDWSGVMATGVIASIPAAALLVVAQRYVAAGIGSGSVKD